MTQFIGDIMHANGKYQKDGEEKTSWLKVGKLFRKEDGSFRVKMDAFPADTSQSGGWLAVFEPRQNQNAAPNSGGGFRNNNPF